MSTTLPMMMDWPVEKARKVRGVGERGGGERARGDEKTRRGGGERGMGEKSHGEIKMRVCTV